ncbi:MAG: metalloregulator ArsR/SmtB family transcription factor [Actinomycetota bacterium]|nr:metalloregulator ArsR/SmtB family transcription factor [Actinomycetota bacterium]
MARAATTSDVFNAVAEPCRRELLAALRGGEVPVAELVQRMRLPQPQVSKHLGVLRQVDLVRCRSVGRQRLYRLNAPALRPIHAWVSEFEAMWNARLDRLDDYVTQLSNTTTEPGTDTRRNDR